MNLYSRRLIAEHHGKVLPVAQTQKELRERTLDVSKKIGTEWIAPAMVWTIMIGIVAALVLTFLSAR